MDPAERELLVARVVSGSRRLRVLGEGGRPVLLVLRSPSRDDRYAAQEVYLRAYEEAQLGESYSDEEVLSFLHGQGLWDAGREALLARHARDIEDFKVKLVEFAFRTFERQKTRLYLAQAKERQAGLLAQRHAYDHLTCRGVAAMARARYLVGSCLHHADGRRVVGDRDLEEARAAGVLLENAVEESVRTHLADERVRELARTEPWRSVWAARGGADSVFGVAAADMTEEQLRLVVWSQMYEGVYQHPECPPDEVVDDDDMLDGWLILQRRKRARRATDGAADGALGSEKVRSCEEVYIVADGPDDAARIDDLNDAAARATKRQRLRHLEREGTVEEFDMPDTRLRYEAELARARRGQ